MIFPLEKRKGLKRFSESGSYGNPEKQSEDKKSGSLSELIFKETEWFLSAVQLKDEVGRLL